MSDKLLELAQEFGVETAQEPTYALMSGDISVNRSRIDIAHDLLVKLEPKHKWITWTYDLWFEEPTEHLDKGRIHDDLESAVIALAERAGVKP